MRRDELLTTGDVAKMIGRSPRTVSRLIKDGAIPYAERLNAANGIYLVRRSDVLTYMTRKESERAAS